MKNFYFENKQQKMQGINTLRLLLLIVFCFLTSFQLQAQSKYVTPDGEGDITFIPGLRIQPKYEFNGVDNNHDFYIARVRLKGKGNIYGMANYYFEVKYNLQKKIIA